MPKRAEALIERRRLEAAHRHELRRARRRGLLELVAVFTVTVPIIIALLPEDTVVTIGPEHLSAIAAEAATTTADAAAITATTLSNGSTPSQPAPRSVRREARRHGGSRDSRWVATECAEVAELVRHSGMPEWMTTVAWRESRCRHDVTNFDRRTADRSYGLFQINVLGDLWHESRQRCGLEHPDDLLDPRVNVSCAAALYRAYGYQPWDSGTYFNK